MREACHCAVLLLALMLAGCAATAVEERTLSPEISAQELSGHVHYLAQPSMQGRMRGSVQNQVVAAYVAGRFREYGLRPWAAEQRFELPSAVGVNVAGILPGSDPAMVDQIVLVVAHLDHLGVVKGKVHPGASDNASGVAALLEMAEQLSLQDRRPRRSVCFLATDAEEEGLLGALAFVQRKDFVASRIAAVVNIDCLGRRCLDTYRDAMLVCGTETLPQTGRMIAGAAAAQGMRILPFGLDLIGLRGDHAAFEPLGVPMLFFTCGPYGDYHKPSDVPDRLNYSKLQRETLTIARTVEALADSDAVESPQAVTSGDREELPAALQLMRLVRQYGLLVSLPGGTRESLRGLIQRGERLAAAHSYTPSQRLDYFQDVVAALPPGLLNDLRTAV